MTTPYSVTLVTKGARGAMTVNLLENGSIIGTFKRPASPKGYIWPFEAVRFFSDRARDRFDNYCNCLSMAEAIETLALDAHINLGK